ncbi:hypothetical protein ACQJBY_069956 [Aegilops geniculata]
MPCFSTNSFAAFHQVFPLGSYFEEVFSLALLLEEMAAKRIEAKAETVESRLQGVNRNLPGNKEQLTRSNIFYGSQKSKVKRLAVGKDILVKLFCATRRPRLLLFKLSQVEKFTENFKLDNVVGRGAFGYVYKGKLPSGVEIAVKRFAASSTQGSAEFTAEIETIANLQHRNVIRLLGFCIRREKDFLGFQIQQEEMILVYEYMPNKSLASFLYDYTSTGESLNWSKRFHIIEGIAQGLVYLHDLSSHQCVVHMDLKPNDILLDYEMNPKISDFGMARILPSSGTEGTSNTVKGTSGYMDPQYIRSGKFSVKSDVYSFGIMILEIISRKKCHYIASNGDMMHLPTLAWVLWEAGKSDELLDASSSPPCNDQQTAQIIRCVHMALLCIQDYPRHRPTMPDVLLMLHSESVGLPTPSMPPNHPVCIKLKP